MYIHNILTKEEIELFNSIKQKPYNYSLYNKFKIPKPNGRYRLIEEPKLSLKKIQRKLIGILNLYTLHPNVYGLGSQEKSAINHAKRHQNNKVIVKMDIEKFFPNTTISKFRWAIKDLSIELLNMFLDIEKVCFVENKDVVRLPTGAPTSPIISSISFTPIDYHLEKLAIQNNVLYTRYVDDITFSGPFYPSGLQHKANKIVTCFGYRINHKKSKVLYKNNNTQIITGVCVNSKPSVGKEYIKRMRVELDKYAEQQKELDKVMLGKINYIRQLDKDRAEYFLKYFQKRISRWKQIKGTNEK